MASLPKTDSAAGVIRSLDYRPLIFFSKKQKILVLDLNETLVHCKTEPFENATINSKVRIGNQNIELFISKRPGLEDFVANMSKIYTLVLFTTGVKEVLVLILALMD